MAMDLENFPTNPTAARMLRMVSPIYDESYVGKWLFQVMGIVLGKIEEAIKALWLEAHPETCTWTIAYWEEAYGIQNPGAGTLEERRNAILQKRVSVGAMNPEKMAQMAEKAILNRYDIEILEDIGAYHLYALIREPQDINNSDLDTLRNFLNRAKQSHMSLDIGYGNTVTLRLLTTGHPSPVDYLMSGTSPYLRTVGGAETKTMDLNTEVEVIDNNEQ